VARLRVPRQHVDMPDVVYLQFAFLLWLAVRRRRCVWCSRAGPTRLRALQEVRQRWCQRPCRLTTGTTATWEHLHDGPLQTCWPARLELDGGARAQSRPRLDRVYSGTAGHRQGAALDRHRVAPSGAGQLGLTPGVREMLRSMSPRDRRRRARGRRQPASQTLMYPRRGGIARNINKPLARRRHRAAVQARRPRS